ncbi:MAG TPA: type II toxin-antitoxin system Phd/YefM family antitoxin [Candidatus Aquilonibacter sp.]|nr:type II toxin-antitoxin system Phd/YefM family antitoxin [Candidatus Aquilonibacter sp.]
MAITTISSREFNQDTGRAKRAARKGPVFITDRGRPAHVLLSIKQYQELAGKRKSIVEMLAMPEVAEIDFEPPRIGGDEFPKPADFS